MIKLQTKYWRVDALNPEKHIIQAAAELILAEETIAFPTETVYGLGALAFSPAAVEKIYQAKGRPPAKPLLIHVNSLRQVEMMVTRLPDIALQLIKAYWPGPLSLVLPADPDIPYITRAGQDTVGIRMPSHPAALALIALTGPLAAPSANISGQASPITADQVMQSLDGRIAGVVDAGSTGYGRESTLVDVSCREPIILRLGSITRENIEHTLGMAVAVGNRQT